jgi:hypothetical protein
MVFAALRGVPMDEIVVFLGRMVCNLADLVVHASPRCYDAGALRVMGYWSLGFLAMIALGRRLVR